VPRVNARLDQIGALIAEEAPFERLSGTVYLDTQAVIQWVRLCVFEEVLDLLPVRENYLPRYRIQDAVFNETLGVLVKGFDVGTFAQVASYLKSHSNLLVDARLEATSLVGKRALAIRQQMCIQAGEDPTVNFKGHMGEAETLAMIEYHEPGSVIVTADRGAIAVARDLGVAHVVRPSAFTGGVLRTRDHVVEMWKYTCLARRCAFGDTWNSDCVERLECTGLTPEAAKRSPISARHLSAVDTLDWAHSDLGDLVGILATKGD
jgi:hypothetical protein